LSYYKSFGKFAFTTIACNTYKSISSNVKLQVKGIALDNSPISLSAPLAHKCLNNWLLSDCSIEN